VRSRHPTDSRWSGLTETQIVLVGLALLLVLVVVVALFTHPHNTLLPLQSSSSAGRP
jgi:predicted RND superfamily exporter protein